MPSLLVLRALNAELSRIKDLTSTPHAGQLRIQWWRDTIGGIYERAPSDSWTREHSRRAQRRAARDTDGE